MAERFLKLKESSWILAAPNTYKRDASGALKQDKEGFPCLPAGNFKFAAGTQSDGRIKRDAVRCLAPIFLAPVPQAQLGLKLEKVSFTCDVIENG